MNERIIKLYEQALEFAYENVSKEIWNTDNFHAIVAGKFAELIVQKCADIGERYADGNYEVPNQILKHFGMEEEEE